MRPGPARRGWRGLVDAVDLDDEDRSVLSLWLNAVAIAVVWLS